MTSNKPNDTSNKSNNTNNKSNDISNNEQYIPQKIVSKIANMTAAKMSNLVVGLRQQNFKRGGGGGLL